MRDLKTESERKEHDKHASMRTHIAQSWHHVQYMLTRAQVKMSTPPQINMQQHSCERRLSNTTQGQIFYSPLCKGIKHKIYKISVSHRSDQSILQQFSPCCHIIRPPCGVLRACVITAIADIPWGADVVVASCIPTEAQYRASAGSITYTRCWSKTINQ